jgi:hypothetical protein
VPRLSIGLGQVEARPARPLEHSDANAGPRANELHGWEQGAPCKQMDAQPRSVNACQRVATQAIVRMLCSGCEDVAAQCTAPAASKPPMCQAMASPPEGHQKLPGQPGTSPQTRQHDVP